MLKPAKSVLYTPAFEPITVLSLSDSAWWYFVNHGTYSFAIMEMPKLAYDPNPDLRVNFKQVYVWAEKLAYRDTKTMMLFTYDDENALLLKSSFLAGQQRELNDERADAFAKGFLKALALL